MGKVIGRKNKQYILEWLKHNQTLTASEASDMLTDSGYTVAADTIRRYRKEFNIGYQPPRPLLDIVLEDMKGGYDFETVYDVAKKYKVSYSYAGTVYRKIKGKQERKGQAKYGRRERKLTTPQVVITAPPVRVNTMEHAVHQLLRCA